MLTSLILSMTLAAPVPPAADKPAPAVESGPVPRLMEVKVENGKPVVTIVRQEKVQNPVPPNGGPAPAIARISIKQVTVELSEIKDLTITTADGKKVTVEEATKKLKDGGTVIVSTDGKPVTANHLKLFKDDVLVFASPELIMATSGRVNPGGPIIRPLPVQPLPAAPAPGGAGGAGGAGAAPGGVIQIQIQPGQVHVVPAPAPQPAPAPAPEK